LVREQRTVIGRAWLLLHGRRVRKVRIPPALDAARAQVIDPANRLGAAAVPAVLLLFEDLAGDVALQEEYAQRRAPVWPALLLFQALQALKDDDTDRAKELLEATFVTDCPVMSTAAAVELSYLLNERPENGRKEQLRKWMLNHGDRGVVTERVFYTYR
jgi:hypothetical protein